VWRAPSAAKGATHGGGYRLRGDCYCAKNDYESARDDYTRAILLDPKCPDYYRSRAYCYATTRDFNLALEDSARAIRLDPENAGAYAERGLLLAATGKFAEAIANYNEAIVRGPVEAWYYRKRGIAYTKILVFGTCTVLGDTKRAMADLTEAIRRDPTVAEAYSYRGRLDPDRDRAMSDLTEAIRLDPKCAEAYAARSSIYFTQRKNCKAVCDLREAVRLDTRNRHRCLDLVLILAAFPDAGVRDGKEAVRLGEGLCELTKWSDAWALEALAAACAEAGDFERAIKWGKVAIDRCKLPQCIDEMRYRLARYEKGEPFRIDK
jgi:tetratricopeptide (TPR) repeat protein